MMNRPQQGLGLAIELVGAGKSFGAFRALDDVSMKVRSGTIHALLGENGAGKSTLVKGLVGYGLLDQGQMIADTREVSIASPRDAQALGIGMVYQHFTLATGLSVEENLLLARGALPWQIDWKRERAALTAFMQSMPFQLPLSVPVASLAAGEKQKLEILKQLYLQQRLLILDEPTSVLTPQEADDVLGLMRTLTLSGRLTVLMITHKFREVMAYADDVTVLRRGKRVASCPVSDTNPDELARWMIGAGTHSNANDQSGGDLSAMAEALQDATPTPTPTAGTIRLELTELCVQDDRGHMAVKDVSLQVRAGEIVGVAGVSGNGQKELLDALTGQRHIRHGLMRVAGMPYRATRKQMTTLRVFAIPEEPLRNACVAGMSVAQNLALRDFDRAPLRRAGWWLNRRAMRERAAHLIQEFNVRPPVPERTMGTLSGGNVQRAVLARELGQAVDVLIVANPVFGLDFASVADIHARIVAAKRNGAAVLLISEDVDELLALADRIVVMTAGEFVFETDATHADRSVLGRYMAGSDTSGRPHGVADDHNRATAPNEEIV
ncbi:ABC transporter ATP-binding protein [Robbsia andropogonis]|uniref:ABC transporter ATP-binding protein n=1 Tax=Robbsia andropogonis TaxID=28092 RepID=UPI0004B512CE